MKQKKEAEKAKKDAEDAEKRLKRTRCQLCERNAVCAQECMKQKKEAENMLSALCNALTTL